MRSHASDPYARIRALWPMLRLFARWMIWQHRVLAASGLLQGRAARWFSGHLGMVEHGLRCLLVIGTQRLKHPEKLSPPPSGEAAQMRGSTPPRFEAPEKWVPVSPAAPTNRDDKQGASPLGWDDNGEDAFARQSSRRFSLTLKAFNLPPDPAPVIPDAQRHGIRLPTAQDPKPVDGPSDELASIGDDDFGRARHDFDARLAALVDVFENTEHHVARMARHLARRNIKLRRRQTTRPSSVGFTRWADAMAQALRSCAPAFAPPARSLTPAPHDTS